MFWSRLTDDNVDAVLREEGARKHAEWLEKDRANIERLRKLERDLKREEAHAVLRRQWRWYKRTFVCLLILASYGLGYANGAMADYEFEDVPGQQR